MAFAHWLDSSHHSSTLSQLLLLQFPHMVWRTLLCPAGTGLDMGTPP